MNEDELTSTYRRFLPLVRGRAQRILGNSAAALDVAQEAFVRLIEYRGAGSQDRDTAAFLYCTATNLALNRLRDARRQAELLAAAWPAPSQEGGLSAEDAMTIRRLLAECDPEQATIASYYYLDGLQHDEIAALLGLQRRTVGRRLESFLEYAQARVLKGDTHA